MIMFQVMNEWRFDCVMIMFGSCLTFSICCDWMVYYRDERSLQIVFQHPSLGHDDVDAIMAAG